MRVADACWCFYFTIEGDEYQLHELRLHREGMNAPDRREENCGQPQPRP